MSHSSDHSRPDENLSPDQVFKEAASRYAEPSSAKFELLEPCRETIAALQAKGVSMREITRVLNESGFDVSRYTVSRFCKTGRKKRAVPSVRAKAAPPMEKPALPAPSPEPTPPLPSVSSIATAEFRPKRRGPRIADPRNI